MRPPRATPPSLRRTLLAWLLIPLALIVPAAVALQLRAVERPAQAAFDQSLANAALAVAAFVRGTSPLEAGSGGDAAFDMDALAERSIRTDRVDTIYYVVLGPRGERVAGDPILAQPTLALAADAWRFFDSTAEDQAIRVAAHGVACGSGVCQVRVAETLIKRQEVFRESLLAALAGVLAVAAAGLAVTLLATRQALRPLRRLGEQMGQRSLDDLRPLEAAEAPRELGPLVEAMNRLLERVRAGSLEQQAFLADAAHQLRTPISVLRSEAELALADPASAAVRPALERLQTAAERAARLSMQLLTLPRSDSAARAALPFQPVDLAELAAEAADDWVPRALEARIDLGFNLAPASVTGQPFLLRELLANLLHNALAYAGAGAEVTVRTGIVGGYAQLSVEDDGPGIPAEEREAVFERFRRGAYAAGVGSGLGLAIVRDIARGHGGRVAIESREDATPGAPPDSWAVAAKPGLVVRVWLPRMAADDSEVAPTTPLDAPRGRA